MRSQSENMIHTNQPSKQSKRTLTEKGCLRNLKILVRRKNAGLKVEGVVDSSANWMIAKAQIS